MDIFKLLSRSSGLQHKKAKVPAAAAIAPPSAHGPNKKRKTKASNSTVTAASNASTALSVLTITESLPELDFFGVSAGAEKAALQAGNSSRKRKRSANGISTADSDEDAGNSSSDEEEEDEGNAGGLLDIPPPPLPTSEESYKLAKEHKLKLTLMNPPPPPPPEPEAEDKSRKKKDKKSKKADPEPEPAKKEKLHDIPPPTLLTSFTQLRVAPYSISKRLYRNLLSQGYDTPTPVQMASIPLLLLSHEYTPSQSTDPQGGRIRTERPINLLTCAQTGSGKTMAYLIPLMDRILSKRGQLEKQGKKKGGTKAVVVAPTKELVGQIYNEGLKLAIGTGVRVTILKKAIVGKVKADEIGEDSGDEEAGGVKLSTGESITPKVKSDIVITTPTMLVHAIKNNTIDLTSVQHLILDEADVLLESNEKGGGFGEDTLAAWEKLKSASTDIRVSMWSATISSSVEALAYSMISPSQDTNPAPPLLRLLTGLKNTSLPHIKHTLTYASTEPGKLLSLRNLLTTSFPLPALIFLQTVPRASALFREIQYDLPPGRIALLHAQLPDTERERVMDNFRKGDIWALITTDLLSRGVDWRGVKLVINYDVPGSSAGYIHRAGRTGRGGREGGEVITFWTAGDTKAIRPVAEVIAQAEKEKARLEKSQKEPPKEGSATWLLDFLPKVTKEEKKKLKKFGVEARNSRRVVIPGYGTATAHGDDDQEDDEIQNKRNKKKVGREKANKDGTYGISTVSGWEKQKKDRLRGMKEASKRRGGQDENEDESESDGEEFNGFD